MSEYLLPFRRLIFRKTDGPSDSEFCGLSLYSEFHTTLIHQARFQKLVTDEITCLHHHYDIGCNSANTSGSSCSKLTMSLVNDLLNFTSSDAQIC